MTQRESGVEPRRPIVSFHALSAEVRVARLRRLSGLAGLATMVLGLVVIAGWVLGEPVLTTIAPGLVTMKFNTAVGLVALGLTTWLLSRRSSPRSTTPLVVALTGGAIILGAITLSEYLTGVDLGIDNPFGFDRSDAVGTSEPGRMSPLSALCLAGVGTALLTLHRGGARAAQWIAGGTLTVSAVAVIGYLFDLEKLYRVDVYTSMAVHTAAALVILSLSVLGLRADRGFMQLVTGDSVGGLVLRRLLPWILLMPTAIGALLVAGVQRGWYDDRFAFAAFVTLGTVVGARGAWVQGRRLRNIDGRRASAEEVRARLQASLAERDRLAAQLISSEKHVREVIGNSVDAYISLSPDGRVEGWNDAATRLFGWSQAEAAGQYLDALMVPPEHAEAHREGLRRASAGGRGPLLGRAVEIDALHRDGHGLWVELTIWAVKVDERWGFHAFLRDVSERRAAEVELRRMNAELRQFAGVVAHDLRTPLTTIAGYAELLRDQAELSKEDPKSLDWIRRIEGAASRGANLIADLLGFTKIGLGDLATEQVDLSRLVGELVNEQRSLGHQDATIQVWPLPTVLGDVSLLRQLFANLIGNALKYADNGASTQVCIRIVPSLPLGRVVVQVSDNGPGIPEAERAHIFEMFQRGADVGSIDGTGIGLAICRQIVERHHGRIWVEDSDLGGAAFHVELPGVPVQR